MKTFQPIMKLTNLCNLDCAYCYYKRTLKSNAFNKIMPEEVWKKTIDKTFEYNYNNDYLGVDFCLHGGEPTLFPIEELKKLINYVKSVSKKYDDKISYSFSIQSNGQFVSDKLIDLLVKEKINVGISIDGPAYLNEMGRKSCNKNTSITENSLNTYKKLTEAGVKCGVLTVITNAHKGKAKELYEFYKNNNIHTVGLLRCFGEGATVDNDVLADFLIEFFDLYFYGDYELNIREFDYAIQNCLGAEGQNVCNLNYRKRCGQYLTVSTNGDLFFCDDDISDAKPFGNIVTDEIEEIYNSQKYIDKMNQVKLVLPTCEKCEVYSVCRTGCHRNDVDGKNYFCKAYIRFYNHVKEIVNKFAEEVK